MIKVRLYNDWVVFKNKKEALTKLLDWMSFSDGSELERYAKAFVSVSRGWTDVDTDNY